MTIRIAIVGFGKIAQDQHLPAIVANPDFQLVAIASPGASHDTIPTFDSLDALLAADLDVDAVALCTPPQIRRAQAGRALEAGLHLLMEKPPGSTLAELDGLTHLATENDVTLFASWHSRFAPAVTPAREWLAARAVNRVEIVWKEDVRLWHPGQRWIWEAGGLGVFDPGINALSIATQILPERLFVKAASLSFPDNCDTPIAADVELADDRDTSISLALDWRQTGRQIWTIDIDTDGGQLQIIDGGKRLLIDGETQTLGGGSEYPELYAHFAQLVAHGRSDADLSPFQLVADAFLIGRRETVARFHDESAD